MVHIADWPLDLNWPFSKAMFTSDESEREFWQHLLACGGCQRGFQERFDDHDLDYDLFWMEVQDYVAGAHLSLERMAEAIRLEARHDLIDEPSEEISKEVWERKREIDYHLMICSKCSRRYFSLYQRVKDYDPDVKAAHGRWYGLRTKSS